MNFLVIGAGAWGTAMAVHLKQKGHTVGVICQDKAEQERIRRDGENKLRMPGVSVKGIEFLLPDEISNTKINAIIVALPSYAFEEGLKPVLESISRFACKGSRPTGPCWISLAKGIVLETLTTPCETLENILKKHGMRGQVLSLNGPQNAGEVAKGLPSATVLSERQNFVSRLGYNGLRATALAQVQEAISNEKMRVYIGHDRRGAELGGAIKNAFAVAAGVCDGLGLGDNAKAGLLTRALIEMARLGAALGGHKRTFFGLTGAGDLMATSYGIWSRNRQLGERVAKGEKPEWLVTEGGLTAEGYRSSKALLELAKKHRVSAPILEQVVAVLHEGKDCKEAMKELMSRPLKREHK